MTDENAGTPPVAGEAPAAAAAAPGTPPVVDEVTTLRSRNAGLDAKVTELTKAAKEAKDAAAAAAAKLDAYEAGTVSKDEALRAQLASKEAELALAHKETQVARIAAKYPETFGVLGEASAALTEDQLAASEARFAGVPTTPETPKPMGANPPRTPGGAKSIGDMTAAELRAHLATFPISSWGGRTD